MAQMFLGAKIRQISYISKFLPVINVSPTKYSYIPNQKVVITDVANLVFLHSAAHSRAFCLYAPVAGVALRLPPACILASPSGFCFSFSPSNKRNHRIDRIQTNNSVRPHPLERNIKCELRTSTELRSVELGHSLFLLISQIDMESI